MQQLADTVVCFELMHPVRSSISATLSHASQTNFVVMQRSSYDRYTAKLQRQSMNHSAVLYVLKKYQEMGDVSFRRDLRSFLAFTPNLFDDEDRERLTNIIEDIRRDQESYNQIKPEIVDAITQMECYIGEPPNAFARSLYVNTLRGDGFFSRYEEDVHFALEDFNLQMIEFGRRNRYGA